MKLKLSLLFSIFLTINIIAQNKNQIKWLSFQEVIEKNTKQPKLVFIDIYTDWCGWCKRMDATSFKDSLFIDYINNFFYGVKLDAEMTDTIVFSNTTFVNPYPNTRRSTHQLATSLLQGKMSYPSFVILNENFQILTIVKGFKSSETMCQILKYFGEKIYLNKTWEEFNNTTTKEVKDSK